MNFKDLIPKGLALVNELSKTDLPSTAKLERVTDLVADFLETADDVVELLPWGFSWLAKLVVDNPSVDALQRQHLAAPIAELLYQTWKGITASGGSLEKFVEAL
jgi:hypothetical protein